MSPEYVRNQDRTLSPEHSLLFDASVGNHADGSHTYFVAAYAYGVLRVILILIPVAITIYALFDAINARSEDIRSLRKWLWIFLIVVLWIAGAILWFVFGRPQRTRASGSAASPRPQGPDDDPEFLNELERNQRKNKEPEEG